MKDIKTNQDQDAFVIIIYETKKSLKIKWTILAINWIYKYNLYEERIMSLAQSHD